MRAMHPQPGSFSAPQAGALCARHPDLQAKAICSRCGSYACAQCHYLGADGMDYCIDCEKRAPALALASRGARFVANLVDQFAVLLPYVAGVFLQVFINSSSGGEKDFFLMGLGILTSIGVAIYQIVLVAQNGQSIGKRMMKIRVVRTDGSPASAVRIIFLRNLVPNSINVFCGLFGFIDVLFIFNDDRRCLHDSISDTKVIEVFPE
jgi:uncharacterized RDD family membrane protein YckC